jgi:hypothetical protein
MGDGLKLFLFLRVFSWNRLDTEDTITLILKK